MGKGFILLNCELGAEAHIMAKLREMSQVSNAYLTFGAYDIVAEIQVEDQDEFEKTISAIRKLPRVVSTMTLNVVELE